MPLFHTPTAGGLKSEGGGSTRRRGGPIDEEKPPHAAAIHRTARARPNNDR